MPWVVAGLSGSDRPPTRAETSVPTGPIGRPASSLTEARAGLCAMSSTGASFTPVMFTVKVDGVVVAVLVLPAVTVKVSVADLAPNASIALSKGSYA